MTNLPKEIMCWHGQWPLSWAGTWATTRYPADAIAYVPKSELQGALERVKREARNEALREAIAQCQLILNTGVCSAGTEYENGHKAAAQRCIDEIEGMIDDE